MRILLATAALLLSAAGAPAASLSYESFSQPKPLPPRARALAHVVRAFGHRHRLALAYDNRLMEAAALQLQRAEASVDSPLSLTDVRACAQRLGWTDGELTAVQVTSRDHALAQALAEELEQTLADTEATAMGIAVSAPQSGGGPATGEAPQATVVVLLSRRLLLVGPVPRQRPSGSQLMLTGTTQDKTISRITVSARCPAGSVVQRRVLLDHGHFMAAIPVGRTPGDLQLELLVERGKGPEVAATFPVQVLPVPALKDVTAEGHVAPQEAAPATPRAQRSTAGHAAGTSQVADLLALVWGVRASHTLGLPTVSQQLMLVAQQHADDMAQHHFFAHVSPTTQDVTHRLKALHEPYMHVVENIAADADLPSAFAQWQQSPGHLRNLLDPQVDHIGVGLATMDDASARLITVLVMTKRG